MTVPEPREHRLFRAVRSTTTLIIIAMGIGLVLAAAVGAVAYIVASALHHASTA